MHFTTGVTSYIISALFMVIGGSAAAQDWVEYENREVGFNINFPVDPIVEAAEYVSPTGETLPAQIFLRQRMDFPYTPILPRGDQGEAAARRAHDGADPSLQCGDDAAHDAGDGGCPRQGGSRGRARCRGDRCGG